MGTSKSYGGGGDKTPLLPEWAQGDDLPAPNPEPPHDDSPDERPPETTPENGENPASDKQKPPPKIVPPAITPRFWQQSKSNMKRFAATGERSALAKAGRGYVRARGGAGRAAQKAVAGRTATARVVGFLSDVARRGIADALDAIGLSNVVGQPVEAVLAAIVNVLAPAGANFDEAAARKTTEIALLAVFQQYDVEANGLARLNEMDAASVQRAFVLTVAEYIFQLWMLELGKRLEEGAVTIRDAARLEKQVKDYVLDATELDLRGRDVLTTDWRVPENQKVITDVYAQAYSFLEAV